MRSGSSYFNYKGTHSIVLMAVCDSHYRIILVNIGESGRSDDGGIFAKSHFGIAFEGKTIILPKSSFLLNTRIDFPMFSLETRRSLLKINATISKRSVR